MKKVRALICNSFLWVLLAPWAVTGLGIASNQAVLIANHDQFPVMVNPVKLDSFMGNLAIPLPNGMIDNVHCIMTPQTHLNALADIFDFHTAIYSVGDFLIILGKWLSIFYLYVWFTLIIKKLWDAE